MKIEAGQIWCYVGGCYGKDAEERIKEWQDVLDSGLSKAEKIGKVDLVVKITRYDGIIPSDLEWIQLKVSGSKISDPLYRKDKEFTFCGTKGEFTEVYHYMGFDQETEEASVKCIKCGKENEYAEPRVDFECWSCRNGW